VAVILVLILRQIIRRASLAGATSRVQLKPAELAYLSNGPARATQVALISLMQRKVVRINSGGAICLEDPAPDARDSSLESAIRTAARTKGTTFGSVCRACWRPLEEIESRLEAEGLVVPRQLRQLATIVSLLIFGAVLSLGFAKLCVGISRQRPVGFL